MSEIPPDTLQAYRETDYRIFAPHPFTLHISRMSGSLHAFYRRHCVACCAYVTACNPRSQILPEDENASRQRGLAEELRRGNLTFIPGESRHSDGGWAEPGFLVLGIPQDHARALGAQFDQNAIVWCGPDATPQLVLLR